MQYPVLFFGAIGVLTIVFSCFLAREMWMTYGRGMKRNATGLLNDFRATVKEEIQKENFHVFLMTAEMNTLKNLNIDYPHERASNNGRKWALTLTADEFEWLLGQVLERAQGLVGDAAREKRVYLTGDALHISVIAMKLQIIQREVTGISRSQDPPPASPVNLASEEMNRLQSNL